MPPEDVRAAIDNGQKPRLSPYPKAAAYIAWGERHGYHNNRTCAKRRPWWSVPAEKGNSFWGKELRDRVAVFVADALFLADCRLYVAELNALTHGILNSTFSILADETNARQYGGGGGPRSVMVYEINNLVTLAPSTPPPSRHADMLRAFHRLAGREICSIFEELGFSVCRARNCEHPEHPYEHVRPEALTLEQVRQASPDRFELDRVVFDVLGLSDKERLEVYRAVVQLVKDRLVKAKSL
jgi:hypothetical protein